MNNSIVQILNLYLLILRLTFLFMISPKQAFITIKRGYEQRYIDNTKHFIFWLCNMKQINFRQFNANSKKFFETVDFSQKEAKTAPIRPILFCLVYEGVFGHFTTIPDYFRRFPKATDDSRILSKISEDQRRGPIIAEDVRRTFGNRKH